MGPRAPIHPKTLTGVKYCMATAEFNREIARSLRPPFPYGAGCPAGWSRSAMPSSGIALFERFTEIRKLCQIVLTQQSAN